MKKKTRNYPKYIESAPAPPPMLLLQNFVLLNDALILLGLGRVWEGVWGKRCVEGLFGLGLVVDFEDSEPNTNEFQDSWPKKIQKAPSDSS